MRGPPPQARVEAEVDVSAPRAAQAPKRRSPRIGPVEWERLRQAVEASGRPVLRGEARPGDRVILAHEGSPGTYALAAAEFSGPRTWRELLEQRECVGEFAVERTLDLFDGVPADMDAPFSQFMHIPRGTPGECAAWRMVSEALGGPEREVPGLWRGREVRTPTVPWSSRALHSS